MNPKTIIMKIIFSHLRITSFVLLLFFFSCKKEELTKTKDTVSTQSQIKELSSLKPSDLKGDSVQKKAVQKFFKLLQQEHPKSFDSILNLLDISKLNEPSKVLIRKYLESFKLNYEITRNLKRQGVAKATIMAELKRINGLKENQNAVPYYGFKSTNSAPSCDAIYQNAINSCNYNYAIAKLLNLTNIFDSNSLIGYIYNEFSILNDLFDCLDTSSINYELCSEILIA
jgi:hypothetical protein